MVNFLNLETAKTPDMQVDWNGATAPLRNALAGYRDGMNQQYAETQRKEQQTYDRGRVAKSDADQQKAIWGKRALAVDQIQDPNQRKAIWGRIVTGLGSKDLTPEELDPMTGPKLMAAEAGLYNDPRDSRAKDLELQYKEAQIGKLNREPTGGEAPSNVREYEYFNKLPPDQQQRYISMKRADKYYNTGTEFVQPDPMNPGTNRNAIPIDVAGKERQQKLGDAQGTAIASLPVVEVSADRLLAAIDRVSAHSSLPNVTGLVGGRVPRNMQMEGQAEVQADIDQIGGSTFLQAYNDLRGGGPIAVAESQAAKEAYNTLQSQTMGTPAYKAALQRFRGEVEKLRSVAREKAGGGQRMEYNVPTNRGGAANTPRAGDPISEAKAAIAAGADPQKVMQRLQQMGIDPRGAQ